MPFRTVTNMLTLLSMIMIGCLVSVPVQADEDRKLPAWAKTLTKAQGEQIEHMHHELEEDQAPFKNKEVQAQKELNEMTVLEDVDIAEVNAKIDELMAARIQIMRLRYDHLIAMRRILTPEQKAGYDKGVLKRSAVR